MDFVRTMCSLLIYGFLFTLIIEEGLSIKCYVCNSHYVKSCETLKTLPDEEKAKFAIDCDRIQAANVTDFTMCRQIKQDIDGDTRLIRQCGSDGRPGECYTRTGTNRIKMEYCECATDRCNSGHSYNTNGVFSLILLVPICLVLTLRSV